MIKDQASQKATAGKNAKKGRGFLGLKLLLVNRFSSCLCVCACCLSALEAPHYFLKSSADSFSLLTFFAHKVLSFLRTALAIKL